MKESNPIISHSWDFGDDREFSQRMKELILSGKKTATTGLYVAGEKHSEVGEFDEILDSDGKPFCVIEYTKIEIKPFLEVDFNYVKLEGESDENMEEWRNNHRKFFLKYSKDFTDERSVVCAQFKLIQTLS